VTVTDFGDLVYLLSKTFKLFGFPNHLIKGEKKTIIAIRKIKNLGKLFNWLSNLLIIIYSQPIL
jgi:hypothetical protein